MSHSFTYKSKIHYDYETLSYGSIIGCTVKPSQFDHECDEGVALTVLTKFDQKNAYYVDFDGLDKKSKDLDKYKTIDHDSYIKEQSNFRFWNDVYFVIPWYRYYPNHQNITNKNEIMTDNDEIKKLLNEEVLALWKNNNNDFSTIYYKAKIIKLPNNKYFENEIIVQFLDSDKTKHSLPVFVNINGFNIPSVIRKKCAQNSLQLKNMVNKKYNRNKNKNKDKETHENIIDGLIYCESECVYSHLAEIKLFPCGHYIWMCICPYCKSQELANLIGNKCKTHSCHVKISGLRSNLIYE